MRGTYSLWGICSPEFKGEQMKKEEVYQLIETGIKELIESNRFKEYLDFSSRMRKYSFMNTLLIFISCPTASRVTGMKSWNELGRHVKKGEKAIKIFAPIFKNVNVTRKNEVTGKDEDVVTKCLTGFRLVPVFDISQTHGKEIPEIVSDFGSDTLLFERMLRIFESKYPITQHELNGSLGGYTDGSNIVLNSLLSEEQRLKTLIHEVAHCELNHINDKEKTRRMQEVEAEMTAYIVSEKFGIDSSQYSFGYMAGWSVGNLSMVREAMDTSFKAAQDIITYIEEHKTIDGVEGVFIPQNNEFGISCSDYEEVYKKTGCGDISELTEVFSESRSPFTPYENPIAIVEGMKHDMKFVSAGESWF
jgi:hypothetical protein